MEFLSQGRRSDILLNKIEALLIFDPLITLWGHFKAPYYKILNDARVASACLYVRICQRVRNSKNIATIRDFHLPSSFFCLSTRLILYMSRAYGRPSGSKGFQKLIKTSKTGKDLKERKKERPQTGRKGSQK